MPDKRLAKTRAAYDALCVGPTILNVPAMAQELSDAIDRIALENVWRETYGATRTDFDWRLSSPKI